MSANFFFLERGVQYQAKGNIKVVKEKQESGEPIEREFRFAEQFQNE